MLEENQTEELGQEEKVQTLPKDTTAMDADENSQDEFSTKVMEIDFESIVSYTKQPRKYFDEDDLESLKQSISENGLLHPIIVCKTSDNQYIVVAGERRRRAIEALRKENTNNEQNRFQKVNVLLVNGRHEEIAIIENAQRSDLTWVEQAEALQRLLDIKKYTQKQLGQIIGKQKSTVSEILSINKIDQTIRDEARSNKSVPQHILIEIAKMKDIKEQNKFWEKYKKKSSTQGDSLNQEIIKEELNTPHVRFKKYTKITKTALTQFKDFNLTSLDDEQKHSLETEITELQTLITGILEQVKEKI